MKNLLITTLVLASLILFSCDKIDNPIQTTEGVITPPETIKRIIIIEEFTGQLCTSCPDGARELERLVSVHGDQIIPISIHAGAFANNGPDAANLVTTAGTDYNTTFLVSSWPAGIVSRVNNAQVFGRAQWETEYTNIKDEEPLAEITITNTYDSTSRVVSIQVDSEFLIDGDIGSNYKLQVYILENHIIAEQLDNGVVFPNYDHKHVLRKAVNTSWGSAIASTSQGTTDTQNFTSTLNATWVSGNCEVVAFIYKAGPDYEVMQASITHADGH